MEQAGPTEGAPRGSGGGRVQVDQAGAGRRSVLPATTRQQRPRGAGHVNPPPLPRSCPQAGWGRGPARRRCWPGASTGSWCLWRWQRGPEGSRGGPTAPARRPGRCWRPCQHRGSGAGGQSCSFLAGGPLTLVTGEQPLTPKSPVSWSPRLLGEWQAPWPSRGSPDRQLSGDEPPAAGRQTPA